MIARIRPRTRVSTAVAAVVLLLAARTRPQEHGQELPVVNVERSGRVMVAAVGSQRVDVLRAFNIVRGKHGADTTVAVLIDSRAPLEDIWNIEAIAGKAQVEHLRFFVAFRSEKAMIEIRRMRRQSLGASIDQARD